MTIDVRRTVMGAFIALMVGADALAAAPVMNLSRTRVTFGYIPPAVPTAPSPVFVTNTGDAALDLSALEISGAYAAEFAASGTCTPPRTLQPGERCRIDLTAAPASRSPSTRQALLTVHSNATMGVAQVTLHAMADPILNTPAFSVTPLYVDFGAQPVGAAAPPATLTITNASGFTFFIDRFTLLGGDAGDFTTASNCAVSQTFRPGDTCMTTIGFTPQAVGPRATEFAADMVYLGVTGSFRYSITGVGGGSGGAQQVTVVEYHNQSLDHYFITWVAGEQANLDAGNTPTRWERTGQTFHAYTSAQAGTSPVCRYYIPPAKGDSHFFGRGTAECDATGQNNPTFVLEEPAFMHLFLPVAGACPAGTTPIYRVFSNRADANHRYMTERAVRDYMVGVGWLAEGDGADLIVMCAP